MSQNIPTLTTPTKAEVLAAVTLVAPPPPANTFELALVMGGTVSAGAYTAGAVDFLIEALDTFQAQKSAAAPYHNVVLKVMTGTSGGAVTAAMIARALNYTFPPRWFGSAAATVNPLFDIWVNQLDLSGMLGTGDITADTIPSLLNAQVLNAAASWIESYAGDALPAPRDWVGAPLTVIMTHTNLSGVPINIDFGGGQYQRYIEHADYARFAVSYPWQPAYMPKPFEFAAGFAGVKSPDTGWPVLGLYALASSAFPIGFPTRLLERPIANYQYRVLSLSPDPASPGDYFVVQPDYEAMLNTNAAPTVGDLRYSAVDGGVADNEPIALAHAALAGLAGHDPQGAQAAYRAVWLIDPFAGAADMAAFNISGIVQTAEATLNASLQQSRYSTADLALAINPNVYSRFMLSAHNGAVSGGAALATGGLSAFLGFACQAFRAHDYYLGRKNCRDFLLGVFRLGKDNPVFAAWSPAQVAAFVDADGELPIIPLFGGAAEAEPLAPWPAGALNPEVFRAGIEARFKAILGAELPQNFWGKILSTLAGFATEGAAADYVIGMLNTALKEAGLLTASA